MQWIHDMGPNNPSRSNYFCNKDRLRFYYFCNKDLLRPKPLMPKEVCAVKHPPVSVVVRVDMKLVSYTRGGAVSRLLCVAHSGLVAEGKKQLLGSKKIAFILE
jgi:hypothetical protein